MIYKGFRTEVTKTMLRLRTANNLDKLDASPIGILSQIVEAEYELKAIKRNIRRANVKRAKEASDDR